MTTCVPVEARLSVLMAEVKATGRITLTKSDLPTGYSADFSRMPFDEKIELHAINGVLYGYNYDCDYGLLMVKLTEGNCKDCGKVVYRVKDNTMSDDEFMDLDEDSNCPLNEEGHEI